MQEEFRFQASSSSLVRPQPVFVLPVFALPASVRREPGRVDAWAATGPSPATLPAQRTRSRRTGPSAGSGLQLAFPSELEASIKAVAAVYFGCVCVCVCVCVYLWARLQVEIVKCLLFVHCMTIFGVNSSLCLPFPSCK